MKVRLDRIETALVGKWARQEVTQFLLFRKPLFAGDTSSLLVSNTPDFTEHDILLYEIFIEDDDSVFMNTFKSDSGEKSKYSIWFLNSACNELSVKDVENRQWDYSRIDPPK